MQIGKVIGNIWATRKESSLTGLKLLIVQPINILDNDKPIGEPVVAADIIGAGTGETVIFAVGSTARVAAGSMDIAVDATVVGIVDDKEFEKESPRYRFSVAHELGHFILHKKYYPKEVRDSKEWIKIAAIQNKPKTCSVIKLGKH